MATASALNPIYTAYIVAGGQKINVTPAMVELSTSESRQTISKSVTLHLMNIQIGGTWLSNLIKARDRVFVYANTGSGSQEVFRGFVWSRTYQSSTSVRKMTLKCFDHLIYLQESEAYEYFEEGMTTHSILAAISNEWNVEIVNQYQSIQHSKLALRGTLADIITSDILELVKDRTGKDYCIHSENDVMYIKEVGKNTSAYSITAGNNAIATASEHSMDGVITKVVILGKGKDDKRRPTEATLTKNTGQYGTLQKIIDRDEDTSLEDAKEDANNILEECAKPRWTYAIKAPDIPWIRKGDLVYVNAGDIQGRNLIVTDIERKITANSKTMEVDLREKDDLR